jgi:hypothetical protein
VVGAGELAPPGTRWGVGWGLLCEIIGEVVRRRQAVKHQRTPQIRRDETDHSSSGTFDGFCVPLTGCPSLRLPQIPQWCAEFVLARAEEYPVPPSVNRCYFFNPFSVEILRAVCARILESWYETPRDIFLFFYYPADEYVSYLMTVEELEFYDEIECDDLFEGYDERERILIFWLPKYEME